MRKFKNTTFLLLIFVLAFSISTNAYAYESADVSGVSTILNEGSVETDYFNNEPDFVLPELEIPYIENEVVIFEEDAISQYM